MDLPIQYGGMFDAVITSPPYHNAVDYYRRHQLEMFWLGHVENQADRLELLPRYIGRQRVPVKHALLQRKWEPGALESEWDREIRRKSAQRADDFRVYMAAMRDAVGEIHRVTKRGAPVVLVVGKSTWNGQHIPTDKLFEELSFDQFALEETLWYPVRNRYMSYSRHNGADIDREYVLALKRL